MNKSKKLNILYLVLVVVYITIGILVLVFADDKKEKNNFILGTLILLSSIPHFILFATKGGFKNNAKYPFLAFALIGASIGLVTIFKKDISLSKVCIMWGCFDICRSTFEVADVIPEIREHKWNEIIELILSIGEIAIAILLIIDEFEGIKLHLIYFGVAFIVSGLKRIAQNLIENYEHKKSFDNN